VLADDHPITRLGMRRALERAGVSVVEETADAEAVVAAVRRRRPDVCLLDAELPGDAIAATRALAAAAPETRVVVLFEPSAEAEQALAALRAGASGCVPRDIGPLALGRAIRGTLRGEATLPRAATARVIEELRCRWGERRTRTAGGDWVTLSSREAQVLELMRRDFSTKEIAERLEISPVTVRRHVSATVRRLGLPDRRAVLQLADERMVVGGDATVHASR
jgi:DNA-binding NarL/FixJ family response regulator